MKSIFFPIAVIFSLFLLFPSCKKDINHAPSCTITSPKTGISVYRGTLVEIYVKTNDDSQNLVVHWYIDGVYQYTAEFGYPFAIYYWNTDNVGSGPHTFKATAEDEQGLTASDEIEIMIWLR